MPEYINPNLHTVHLTGPDGQVVKVRSKQKVTLIDYFDRYRARGFLQLLENSPSPIVKQTETPIKVQSKIKLNKVKQKNIARKATLQLPKESNLEAQRRKQRRREVQRAHKISAATKMKRTGPRGSELVVGRRLAVDATELLRSNLEKIHYPISNNIGVGIMSYNRVFSLKRLIDSIGKTTDLRRTTVFISDDASTEQETIDYLEQLAVAPNFVVIRNKNRGGISINNNRLIRCLSRFNHGLILNDDVEVLKVGWDEFYKEAMIRTGMHHFQFRQAGVYGAKLGDHHSKNGLGLRVVKDRPQGAVMAFSREMLVKSGYFDENYGLYGMEHVDWSMKAWEVGLQEEGFFDVDGSEHYFRIHSDTSAVEERTTYLKQARKVFENRQKQRIGPTSNSRVPEISYVVPFRNINRADSIRTVINNIRAQRFPVIHIIMIEQDTQTNIDLSKFKPAHYFLAQEVDNRLFNKAIAFNLGVSKVSTENVILHDADMIVQGNYTQRVYETLQHADSCHLGGTVIYASQASTDTVNSTGEINKKCGCDRVIGYFEGGSLACKTNAYWMTGGFNEDFWGYGCEDCDFYARLSGGSNWKEDRVFDFLHLWHSRVSGWDDHHKVNKLLEAELKTMPTPQRIARQHQQLRNKGYRKFLGADQ
jgi:glycosyltransferase involved in cell wall biosynthesis